MGIYKYQKSIILIIFIGDFNQNRKKLAFRLFFTDLYEYMFSYTKMIKILRRINTDSVNLWCIILYLI